MKNSKIYEKGGCCFYSSCLDCPFPLSGNGCLFDAQGSVLSELRKAEARELAKQGKSVSEIATIMELSRKQVKRYLDMGLLTEP